MHGVPWKTSAHADGDDLRIRISIPTEDGPLSELVRPPEMSEPLVRRFRINPKDIEKFGYTKGCGGCKCLNRNLPSQNHSEACRSRLTAALAQEGDVRLSREKRRMEDDPAKEGKKRRAQPEGPPSFDVEKKDAASSSSNRGGRRRFKLKLG